ncbi:hypothetical protein DICVIV_11539 [Dictyocaulus viviparus]|uniref:Uncharacterized protein n=1 Tax=Dictyocaulus viviparus TaxID=29172 RepID=A0A0D8XJG9_DICVI|nr:hypothetical protein DICVIV_11539 [Dictyocaulus viviparus]
MVLLLLLFCPLIIAEPFIYVHPVNPKLHPKDMYPIQKPSRGFEKIRDLPQSGIVYLNRIKPISEEFKGAVVHGNNTFVKNETSVPLIQLSTENDRKIAVGKVSRKQKEAELSIEALAKLERLLYDIKEKEKEDFIEDNPAVELINMPEINQAYRADQRRRASRPAAKLISLDRTSSIHSGSIAKKSNSEKQKEMRNKQSINIVGGTAYRQVEFDPWERIGSL